MKRTFLLSLCTVSLLTAGAQQLPIYQDPVQPIEARVEDALSRMTTAEKIAVIHAQSKFSSAGVQRLGIPELWMTDGPHGIRPEVLWDEWDQAGWSNDSCTAFPALTCLAATWNPDMAMLYGKSIGEEARYRKKDVLLGPGVNIYRTPLNGRNFEYMGEDPYLASRMVVPYIKGVQQNGVAACVKHYALNNQEYLRHQYNAVLDDRALYEIYLPAFRAAVVEGGAWAIMPSYNLYRKEHAAQNRRLLNDILRGEWKFDGVAISDWGAVHDTRPSITQGVDMEFGSWTNGLTEGFKNAYDSYYLAQPYLKLIEQGVYGTQELDDKVRRVLRLAFRTAMNTRKPIGSMNSPAHSEAARRIADEGIVLLKNDRNVLPIDLAKRPTLLVVGENAVKMMTVGGGSSSLKARYEISPLDGLRQRVGTQGTVKYVRGYVGDVGGSYNGVQSGQDLNDDRTPEQLEAEAVDAARRVDYVVYIGGLNKSNHQDCEDSDRTGLELPYGQDRLISALAKANPNLIVVNISGNAVAMPWVKEVPAIVQGWYLGSETGHALAGVLTGDVNPSGRLPFTFPVRLSDVGAHRLGEYPGNAAELELMKQPEHKNDTIDVTYREGIFVGYRFADKERIAPLFAFGHGLSYTTFAYSKPTVDKKTLSADGQLTVSLTVTNTGMRDGEEVVQLYISDLKSSLPRPVKELKAFRKVALKVGESKEVQFTVDRTALSYFDDRIHRWVAEPGMFEAIVAASASDIRGKVKFALE
ncbi:MAG: glycoside hydrolase family 3 C-terminal domain-containing protein [Prevotellaceae bacterium]|jgi:beta-glucosidase|nr:glycoside hydrolase family 3 C-terminal domain-containing protein [Prevotellaceae bacterium]